MGEKQLAFVIEKPPIEIKITQINHENKQKRFVHKIKTRSLFEAQGLRHSGHYALNEKFKCLKCERPKTLYPKTFCSDCRSSETYRFAGIF